MIPGGEVEDDRRHRDDHRRRRRRASLADDRSSSLSPMHTLYQQQQATAEPTSPGSKSVEVYGFVSWVACLVAGVIYLAWAFIPDRYLREVSPHLHRHSCYCYQNLHSGRSGLLCP